MEEGQTWELVGRKVKWLMGLVGGAKERKKRMRKRKTWCGGAGEWGQCGPKALVGWWLSSHSGASLPSEKGEGVVQG